MENKMFINVFTPKYLSDIAVDMRRGFDETNDNHSLYCEIVFTNNDKKIATEVLRKANISFHQIVDDVILFEGVVFKLKDYKDE